MAQKNKPLIFLEPLSQTLQKLKEIISENAESEGIEVFQVDEIAEMAQLLPTVGQSLTLTSSPKKCAIFLQSNKRNIKSLQSKTLLLSPKAIPRKTLDKFMKVGLTECIVEPVNPKTLLYKVRLQIRSLSTQDEEEEMSSRFSKDVKADDNDKNGKLRTEKGVIWDDEETPDGEKKERKEMEEVLIDDPKKSKKKYQEESIDGYYKGKKKEQEEVELDLEGKPKKKYQEESIDGHYKGNLAKKAEELREEARKKAMQEVLEDDVEGLDEVKKRIELEFGPDLAEEARKELEEELLNERKKAPVIQLQEEDVEKEKREKGELEDLGGHYKGKVKKNDLEVEEEDYKEKAEKESPDVISRKKKKKALELVEEKEDYLNKKEETPEESFQKEKKKKLDVLMDDSDDYLEKKVEEEQAEEEKKKKKALVLEDSDTSEKDNRKVENNIDGGPNKGEAKTDQIDGYLRGGAAKKDITLEDEEDLYHNEKKEQEHLEKKKNKEALLLEEDGVEKDPLLKDKEYEDDFNKKKKKEKLLLEDDEDLYGKKNAKSTEEDGFGKRRSNYQDDATEGYTKGQGSGKKEDLGRKANRSDARADKIQTHYSSKESLKHGSQDWGDKWEKQTKEEQEYEDPRSKENELIIEKKKDLGEQTIDYGQLKKEFEAISIDGVSNKKKQYGLIDNVIKAKTYKKKVSTIEGTLEEMEFEEIENEVPEEEGEQVFEPVSLGMEIAIEVLEFYFEKDMNTQKLCRFLNERIKQSFLGQMVFYSFAQGEFPEPLFNGLLNSLVGDEPNKPPESELESYSRLERKEIEDDYKAELKDYKKELSSSKALWEEKYQVQLADWREFKTPDWKDHTFQIEENFFIFPFYEGVTLMGLTVFIPEPGFNPEKSDALEAVFEVARGIFVTEYHNNKGEGKIREAKKKEQVNESKGLFGRLFKKTGS